MFTGGIVLAKFFPQKYEYVLGKKEIRWNVLPAILMVVPYIVWAGFRTDIFGDTAVYRQNFINAPNTFNQIFQYVSEFDKDKGFRVITAFIKVVFGNSDIFYFILLATIQMLIIAFIYRKYSCNYWLSIFLFIASTDYMSFAHNGLRQFMAVTIMMVGFPLLLKKKYVPLIILILLAATMHASALLMLPIVFIVQGKAWNKRTLICLIFTVIAIIFVDQFTNILDDALVNTQYSNMVTDWIEWEDDGTNPIRVFIYCIPMILSLLGMKWIKNSNDPIVHILTNFSIITAAFGLVSMVTSGIFIGRLIIYGSIYSTSLLLPWEIEQIFTKNSARVVNGLMIIGYLGFYYYQMHVIWELI